jgi:hypothetical protein
VSARATCRCGWAGAYSSRARAAAMAARHVCPKNDGVRRATRRHRCARCGLEAVYENAGAAEARHWFGKHSCRKREDAMLRTAQAELRKALIDRTPKPCLHKIANHQHGTRSCYVLDKCRCTPCSQANAEAETWRERQKAYGRYNKFVPAGPVREHVRSLTDAGMGLKRISKVSSVSHGSLWKLMYGKRQSDGSLKPSRRVTREIAEKLYAIDADWGDPLPLAGGALLDEATSAKASRKLQALVALGWSMSELGRRLGHEWSRNAIPIIKAERRLTVATAKKAEALYEQLSMTLPPESTKHERVTAARARNFARRHDWVPPLELEDDSDDNAETTDTVDGSDLDEQAIWRREHGDKSVRLTEAEIAELVRRWKASGRSLQEMKRVTGVGAQRARDAAKAAA